MKKGRLPKIATVLFRILFSIDFSVMRKFLNAKKNNNSCKMHIVLHNNIEGFFGFSSPHEIVGKS